MIPWDGTPIITSHDSADRGPLDEESRCRTEASPRSLAGKGAVPLKP
jgi:hypothetical protein